MEFCFSVCATWCEDVCVWYSCFIPLFLLSSCWCQPPEALVLLFVLVVYLDESFLDLFDML